MLNVSTGHETSVAGLASLLGLKTELRPGRAGEILRSCLDPTAAAQSLGWRAKMSLADGLETIR